MSYAAGQPSAAGIALNVQGYTDTAGRPVNEDNCTVEPLQNPQYPHLGIVGAVADGMGGGESGQTASNLAISSLREGYFESGAENPMLALQQAADQSNRAVYAFAATRRGQNRQLGSTLVMAAIANGQAYIVNVGDSRAYLVRGGQAQQITTDHNWANQQIALGRMTAAQANADERAALLTQVLGQGPSLQIPITGQADGQFSYSFALQAGDAIVLCSDGVSNVVGATDIARLALSGPADQAARNIVEQAKANRTSDNASAVVFHYGITPARRAASPPWLPIGAGVAALLVVLVLGVSAVFGSGGSGNNSGNGGGSSTAQPITTPNSSQNTSSGGGNNPTSTETAVPDTAGIRATSTTLPGTPTSTPAPPTNTASPAPPTTRPANNQPAAPVQPRATNTPRTAQPPPAQVPPTEVPPTEVPPTEVPPTEVPPTEVPPTAVPPTAVPPTEVPPTEVPPSNGGSGGGDDGGGGGDDGGGGGGGDDQQLPP